MKHKVSELEGVLLDIAVAKAEELEWKYLKGSQEIVVIVGGRDCYGFRPSNDWSHGGPIIEREKIKLRPPGEDGSYFQWTAGEIQRRDGLWGLGETPLIAAMRAFVASKFGEEVELP